MPPDEIDDLLDDVFPDNTEEVEEKTEDEPEEKVEKEEKPKAEEKPAAKPLVTIDPNADAAEIAFQAGEIAADMKSQVKEKFGHQLTDQEINDQVMKVVKSYGVKALPGLFNSNFHIKCGHVAVGEKRDAGKLDETAKPKRETTSVGGGAAKTGNRTKGDDILNRIVGRDGKPDPKIRDFFASKGMKV